MALTLDEGGNLATVKRLDPPTGRQVTPALASKLEAALRAYGPYHDPMLGRAFTVTVPARQAD